MQAHLFLLFLFFMSAHLSLVLDKALIKKYIPYVTPLIIVGICNNFIQYGGAALIKYFIDIGDTIENLSASGVFDSSRRIAILFAIFVGAYNYAAEPFFFNNSSEKDKETYYGKICKLFVLIGGLALLAIVFSLDIIQLFVDESFRESVFIIPILLLAYLFLGVYHNISIWYKLSDKTIYGSYISIAGLCLTLLLSILLLNKYGYVVVAWANLASYVLMVICAYLLGQKHYPINYPVMKILECLLILCLILVFNNWIESELNVVPRYISRIILFAAYALYIFKSERETFLNALFKRG